MKSPAQLHREKKLAALTSQADAEDQRPPENASQYELMQINLAKDKRRLKELQSIEKKAELKREILPDYQPWVDGVIDGDSGLEDKVLMTVLVWHIDAGNMAEAIRIAEYAFKHNLSMPDQYERKMAVVVAEEIADHYLKADSASKPLDLQVIERAVALVKDADMPDEVRAKLLKVNAYALIRPNGDANQESIEKEVWEQSLALFKRAVELHEKVGVKKDIEFVERQIKNLATE